MRGSERRGAAMPEWRVAMLPALAVSFALIAVSITAMAIISDSVTKGSINSLVGEQSTFASHAALARIDEEINDRIGELRVLGTEPRIRAALAHHSSDGDGPRGLAHARAEALLEERIGSQGAPFAAIALLGADGRTVAVGGAVADTVTSGERDVLVSDAHYDATIGRDVIRISTTLRDAGGAVSGELVAFMEMHEVYRIARETQNSVRLGMATVDIYRLDGRPVYASSPNGDFGSLELVAPGFAQVPEGVRDELERRFEEIDAEYERVFAEYGFEQPVLDEDEAHEYMVRVRELDERYMRIISGADGDIDGSRADDLRWAMEGALSDAVIIDEIEGIIDEASAGSLEDVFEAYDVEHSKIAADYGISHPMLTEDEEIALAAETARIDEMSSRVYDGLDVDYTFGERGFVIVGHGEEETLHSFSRQAGYGDFDGLGWTLVVHTNLNDALVEANSQRNALLALAAVIGIVAGALSAYLARTMYFQSRRLRQTEKIGAIGHLASNIAHDLRNPLGIIRNSTERIRRQAGGGDGIVDGELDRVNRAISRMSHQIEGVLNYVRTTPVIAKECRVSEMLKYAVESIEIPANVSVELPHEDAVIECDREKIEITFANLLLNAVHAIGEQDGTIAVRMAERGDAIHMEFENTGPAIPMGDLPHIFEPLFTTKLKGTGLGLSGCRNIVEQHGGTIGASASPVVFAVMLPKRQR